MAWGGLYVFIAIKIKQKKCQGKKNPTILNFIDLPMTVIPMVGGVIRSLLQQEGEGKNFILGHGVFMC